MESSAFPHSATEKKVHFEQQGLQFAVPAILTFNYSPCVTPLIGVTVVYLQADTVVEVIRSTNDPMAKTVSGVVRHFSSYAVAY